MIEPEGQKVTYLFSEYVEGDQLQSYLDQQRGKRLSVFQGLHLLHALAKGIEDIHNMREYHGDLHAGNVIVQRHGLSYTLKLLDMFHWGRPSTDNINSDVCNLVRIFYDSIGGASYYSSRPKQAKDICCGLKNSLILKKFKTAGELQLILIQMF